MNVQFAIKDNVLHVLEVNPRASRTVPFVAKAIGVPLAKLAAQVMTGAKLKDLGFTRAPHRPVRRQGHRRAAGQARRESDDWREAQGPRLHARAHPEALVREGSG